MEKLSTREIFNQLQERLIINLDENEMLCSKCKGLRFILVENNGTTYIESCRHCHTGKLYICKHCGKGTNTDHCNCNEAVKERDIEFRTKQTQKENEAFKVAKKIHYKDYDGYYIIEDEEHIKDFEDLEYWIYDKLRSSEDVPEYLWAVEKTPHISIDLKEVISDKCEDGYEDMYDHLNTDSNLLDKAQELVTQWENEQGDSICIFNETYKKAVMIKDLVEEIRNEINK